MRNVTYILTSNLYTHALLHMRNVTDRGKHLGNFHEREREHEHEPKGEYKIELEREHEPKSERKHEHEQDHEREREWPLSASVLVAC